MMKSVEEEGMRGRNEIREKIENERSEGAGRE